jgi:protein-S-isoprenylcysteine O-methyltransferase Ste14
LLVFLPARILLWSGIVRPAGIGLAQVAGMAVGASGAILALWCILTFAVIGRGTPAPFDPPRELVVVGPYRLVRNPMYLGAALALLGAALFYQSWALLAYCVAFALVTHLFVVAYEEPTLRGPDALGSEVGPGVTIAQARALTAPAAYRLDRRARQRGLKWSRS